VQRVSESPSAAPERESAPEPFDVIVVGARCAGAPLATLLADQGARVVLVERAEFPRDTLSSHLFEADALAFLDRLGVADELRGTGAPFVGRTDMRVEDCRFSAPWPQRPGDIGGIASVRRVLLDPILARRAERAGAEVRMATSVTDMVVERDRVIGVRTKSGDGETRELHARVVVGADGRNSTVAKLGGASTYNLTPNQRLLYWAYFEGAELDGEPTFVSHRWGDRFILAIPADSGLYQVLIWPELSELACFRDDLEASFMLHARSCEPIASALLGARRVGHIQGAIRWSGYFRQAAGPGWVLTGDAGHFKSPAPGRGIGDAFLQAEALAPILAEELDAPAAELDRATARWGEWRDAEFAEHYWLASDLEQAGAVPAVLPEIVSGLHRQGNVGLFLDLVNHRARPSAVLTPPRLLRGLGRALRHRGADRRLIMRETATLLKQERRRRRLNRRPALAPPQGGEIGAQSAVSASESVGR
jgi:flavin-dependent dehydrogenase